MHVTNNMSTYIQNRQHINGIYTHIRDNGHLHIFSNSKNLFVNLGYIIPLNLQCYLVTPCEWKCERGIILQSEN
jgi:hypothetical protein